jgi:hypothetical protein
MARISFPSRISAARKIGGSLDGANGSPAIGTDSTAAACGRICLMKRRASLAAVSKLKDLVWT